MNNYQPGQQPGVPYPQQGYSSNGRAPYPTSVPPYPSATPNALGFNGNAPMFMPQPMPIPTYTPNAPPSNTGGYPPSSGGYPPSSGGFPPSSGGFPPSNSGYPPPSSGYQPSSGAYPPSSGGYPPSSGGYPPSGGGYQAPSVDCPPSSGSYLRSSGGYPPSSGGYSPSGGGYPASSGGCPPASGRYPPSGGVHPPSMGGGAPSSSPYSPSKSPYPSTQNTGSYSHSASGAPGQHEHDYRGSKGPYEGKNTHSWGSNLNSASPKRTPTLVPANPFNPRADAEILRKAMKGFGTDEKAIINVLAYRINAQRLQIAIEFKTLYGKDLVKDLKSECTGNFENILVAMMTPLPQFYARELHDAMQGLGTDEDVLIEIMCTKSNQEIMVIRQAYHSMFFRSLEEDLMGDTGGTFKRLMVSLCNAGRDESMGVNPDAARADAQALLRAGELRLGTDESTFNAILCQRNYAHLQLVFQEYERLTGHDIEKAIKNEFSGDAEQALLAVIRSIKNQSAFFAKLLNKSMKGMGTNDRDLIRLVVTRSEIDMVEIKREYQAKYGESLADAIKGDCSGDYKKCILHLIGEA